jgi:Cu+-exporting ATPase
VAGIDTKEADNDLYLLRNDTLQATIDIGDELRPGADQLIQYLNERGIRTAILSGDRTAKTAALANDIGVDTYFAEQLPDQKIEQLKALQAEGPVAMVGDGINDAPALSAADVGVSLGSATQIASDAADIILLRSDLNGLRDVLDLGSATIVTIQQNLGWAVAYNIVAIPVAALGFLSPMVAALSMAFSDVVVVGNSLRLRLRKIGRMTTR